MGQQNPQESVHHDGLWLHPRLVFDCLGPQLPVHCSLAPVDEHLQYFPFPARRLYPSNMIGHLLHGLS